MKWDEFVPYLAGLMPETPLGRIVSIRGETDSDVIKNFKPEERKIFNDWQKHKAESIDKEEYLKQMDLLEKSLKSISVIKQKGES